MVKIRQQFDLNTLEMDRQRNLRQLMLRASRVVNRDVVEGLNARGYSKLRSTHTALLSNMDLAGDTATAVAEKAGVTKQVIGRLASELERLGYLSVKRDPQDARTRILGLTKTGRKLMLDSFEVMASLERRYAHEIGGQRFAEMLESLKKLTLA